VIEKTLLMRNAVGRLTDDDDDDDEEEEEEEKGDNGGGAGSSRRQRKNCDMIAEQKVLQVQALEQQQKQVLQLLAAEKKLNQRLLCQPFWWRQSVAVSSGIHELQYVQQRIDALYQLLVTRASCLQQQQQQHTAAVVNSTPILFNEDHDQSQFLHLELAPDPSCSTLTTNAARQQIYDLQQQQQVASFFIFSEGRLE